MKYLSIITLLFFISTSCLSQEEIFSIQNWENDSALLNVDSLKKNEVARAEHQAWYVFLKNDTVFVTKNRSEISGNVPSVKTLKKTEQKRFGIKGVRTFIKVDRGYLVGYFFGEWGGELRWFSKSGNWNYEIRPSYEVVRFIKRNNKIYAIEGLAHLSTSEGGIIEVKKIHKKWTTSKCLTLPSAPFAISLDKENNFIIAASNSLISVDTNFKIKTLIDTEYWWWLMPTSLVIKDNIVYIGTFGGIFRYDLATGKKDWFTRKWNN